MGLFWTSKSERIAETKKADAKASTKRAEAREAEAKSRSFATQTKANVDIEKAKIEAELQEKAMLMKMSVEEREAYLKQIQDMKDKELEQKKKDEEYVLNQQIEKQSYLKKRSIAIAKTRFIDYRANLSNDKGSVTTVEEVKGQFGLVEIENPFLLIKYNKTTTRILSSNTESEEIEVSLENLYNLELNKSFMSGITFSFNVININENNNETSNFNMPKNNYSSLDKIADQFGKIIFYLQNKKDSDVLNEMIGKIKQIQDTL